MKRTSLITLLMALGFWVVAQTPTRKLTVKLRGVYDAKITLTAFDGVAYSRPMKEVPEVMPGQTVGFELPTGQLPGEFLLRFDYRAKAEDYPYPAELPLYINREDISVDANPLYLRGDSLRVSGDRENAAFANFSNKNMEMRQQIGLLEQLLQQYTYRKSAVYTQAAKEYLLRMNEYNRWIDAMAVADRDLYVGHLYSFQHRHPVNWAQTPDEQMKEQVAHWFAGFNFNDTLLLHSRQMNEFMNGYLGVFGAQATSVELRDSLFTQAGRMACELASTGNPKVYGWITDYFFNGYETYDIKPGISMLEKHLNNPNCMTRKRIEIERRLKGIEKMVKGVTVPNLRLRDEEDREVNVTVAPTGNKYALLVFYESDCGHCTELLDKLQKWHAISENKAWFNIVTIGLDSNAEVWREFFKKKAFPWTDLYAEGGINSTAANDYYVLGAPSLFVVDGQGKLCATPLSVEELDQFLKGN